MPSRSEHIINIITRPQPQTGRFYAAARLPVPDPLQPTQSHAAPHKHTKPAYNGPVLPCDNARRPQKALHAVFLSWNVFILPGLFSPFLEPLTAPGYSYRTILGRNPGKTWGQDWKNLEIQEFWKNLVQK